VIEVVLTKKQFRRYFPLLAGVIFAGLFVALGFWQLDRAQQKKALLAQFADDAPYTPLDGTLPQRDFQAIETRGRYLGERQILIENIVRDGQVGYFIITPFEQSIDRTLLLVNRGWLPRSGQGTARLDIDVGADIRRIRGRAGHLPNVSVRPGNGFDGAGDWPKNATYPTLEEVANELNEELLPFVLLLATDEDDGFRRQWQPQQSGPMINYGYAFQWFAMAAAVLAIIAWHVRRGSYGRETGQQK
jgi:surfeit locus 1 family protein